MNAPRNDPFIAALLHGPPTPTPPGATFRRAGGFDGGARQSFAVVSRSPDRDHDELIARLALQSRAGAAHFGF